MSTPSLERALAGFWLASESLDEFVEDLQAVEDDYYGDGPRPDFDEAERERLMNLTCLPEDDAVAIRWQCRHIVSILESVMPTCRVNKARAVRAWIAAQIGGDEGH